MPDIVHDFPIARPAAHVFRAISTPEGLNGWWTNTCTGRPAEGERYQLGFGPQYQWEAVVSRCEPDRVFELRMTQSDADWNDSRVTFHLEGGPERTWVRFAHTGWPTASEHYRISSFCWAMYLRHLKRLVEKGEVVPYETRLDA